MGNEKSMIIPTSKSETIPFVYYLNRKEGFILYLTQNRTKKFRFKVQPKLYPDSALCYLSDTTILIAGGTNSKGKLKTNCYILDFDKMSIQAVTPLPVASKLGHLIDYKDSVFYVGGTTENQNSEEIHSQYVGSPIMKYRKSDNSWEVFLYRDAKKIKEKTEEKFSLRNLLYPGAFMIQSKIYFFGGTVLSPEVEINYSVFSIDLESVDLNIEEEKYEFPIALNYPEAGSNSKFAFIHGGVDVSSLPNKLCYIFTLKKGFSQIGGKNLEVAENYPPRCTKDYIIAMAFPRFALKLRQSEGWMMYSVAENRSALSPVTLINSAQSTIKNSPLYTVYNPSMSSFSNFQRMRSQAHAFKSSLKHNTSLISSSFSSNNKRNFYTVIPKGLGRTGEVLTNSPRMSRSSLRFEENDKIVISPQLGNALIVMPQTDPSVKMPHKLAVKFLALVSGKINQKNMNPLQVNHLSHTLGYKQDITIVDLEMGLGLILQNQSYPYVLVRNFIKNFSAIFQAPEMKASRVKEIMDLLDIPNRVKVLSRQETILILSRMAKACITSD